MSIIEEKTINEETYPYIFPDVDLKVQSVFRRRNKTVIPSNISMLTNTPRTPSFGLPTATLATGHVVPSDAESKAFDAAAKKYIFGDNSSTGKLDTKPNATSTFEMNASENQLFRLQDAELNFIAQYAYFDYGDDNDYNSATTKSTCPITKPMFGNQCLLSLFQAIELRIDGIPIERNAHPGFSCNMDYALKYPHCKSLEKDYEIHGFTSTDSKKYVLPQPGANDYEGVLDAFNTFEQQGITCQVITIPRGTNLGAAYDESTNKYTSPQKNFYTGFINQRIKLSDIFSCVRDMPTIFNHKIEIVLQRTSQNDIICNTFTTQNVKCQFLGFWTYNLIQYISETTNELSDYARAYYSKPIETMITVKKDVMTPFVQRPTSSGSVSFNLGIDPSFKNCLLTIAIPRSSDMSGQFNSNKAFFTTTDKKYSATLSVDNTTSNQHYDAFYAPANSYTYGGLKFLTVYNSGNLLYKFDMENEGLITGPVASFRKEDPNIQHNFKLKTGEDTGFIHCANYQDVYIQYLRAREHFEEPENEAIDYNTFMKEYCMFCIDLSCFEIPSNGQLTIVIGYSSWDDYYNPYYQDNTMGAHIGNGGYSTLEGIWTASQIVTNLYCKKILRLMPGRSVGIYDGISTSTSEVGPKITV
ncbi:MAG: hypothetical protein VZR33_03960 [Methanosphaera sp.]|nr:hypothetical protein [Methanosphaera sp.]